MSRKYKFMDQEEDWLYSSARNYHGLKGLLHVILIEPRVVIMS